MFSSNMTLNQGIDLGYLSSINAGTFALYKEISKQYNDNGILAYVNHMIPQNVLMQFNDCSYHEEQSFKAILQWFKNEFMTLESSGRFWRQCNIW
jgi:hypothetical protein